MDQIRRAKAAVRKRRSVWFALAAAAAFSVCIPGCVRRTDTEEKIRDLEFTVLDKEEVPPGLSGVIEEKKEKTFQISYGDQGILYIAEGYGGQPTSGYSVAVDSLYETEDAVCIHTSLMGPEKGEETEETVTYPYVVVRLEYIGKDVIFN